jgi:protein O-GlcNAc transferase
MIEKLYPEKITRGHGIAVELMRQGKLDEAKAIYKRLILEDKTFLKAYNNLGIINKLQGRLQEAEKNFKKALKINPKLVPVISNLANIYRIKGEIKKAEKFCRRAIELDCSFADAYNILGAVMQIQGNPKGAIKNYRRAIKLAPNFDDAYSNLAGALQSVGRIDEALELCYEAIKKDWENPDPYYNMGNILKSKRQFAQAVVMYEKVIGFSPDFSDAYDQLIDILRQLCEWEKLKKISKKLDQMIDASLSRNVIIGATPFNTLIRSDSPQRNLKIAKLWSENISASAKNSPFKYDSPKNKPRLRIGYVSGDFTDHPVTHIMKSMFKFHDRKKFEIYCYSFNSGDNKGFRKQVKKNCDIFRDIDKLSFDESAKLIHKDKIDILIDLMGYTSGNRFEIFAKCPAPIQVSYLGFPGSTGADFIDYHIVDHVIVPPGEEINYSEKLVFMPDCYQINDGEQKISKKKYTRSEVGLPGNAFVFCSFNVVSKITRKMFKSWMKILAEVPNSVLWLPESMPEAEKNLKKFAGLTSDRIIFGKHLPLEEHLKRLTLADLMLDTHPYSGGATTSHALRMGVPVVTLSGKSYISRMSSSLLTCAGLPELITEKIKDYEALTIKIAKNPKKFTEVKNKLKENLKTSSLYGTSKFTANLEKSYNKIWEDYLGDRV